MPLNYAPYQITAQFWVASLTNPSVSSSTTQFPTDDYDPTQAQASATSWQYAMSGQYGDVYSIQTINGLLSPVDLDTSSLYGSSVPTAPVVQTLAASAVGSTSATLNAQVSDTGGATITQERFYWGSTPSCSDGFNSAVTVNGNSFSFTLTGLTPGQPYYFEPWAENTAGWGNGSALSFTTTSSVTTLAAQNLTSATPKAGGTTPEVDLAWGAVTGATNYNIYRNGSLIFTTAGAVPTFSNTSGLVAGQSYTYQIQALSGSLSSPLSNSINVAIPNTLATVPPVPQNVPSVANLPSEPDLWIPQTALQQTLMSDSSVNQYFIAQSTPLVSANTFISNPTISPGWKNFFANASSVAHVIGTATGFAGDDTPGKLALDGGLWVLQQTDSVPEQFLFESNR